MSASTLHPPPPSLESAPIEERAHRRRAPSSPVLAVALFELGRLLRSAKARWVAGGLLVAAALPSLTAILRASHDPRGLPRVLGREPGLTRLYDADVAREFLGCPRVVVALGVATLFLTPILTLALTYDTLSTTHGAPLSPGKVVGKTVADWFACSALIALCHAPVWIAAIVAGAEPASAVLRWGGLCVFAASVAAASYTGLWVLVSALARSSVRGFWWGVIVAFLLTVVRGVLHARAPIFEQVMPGALDKMILSARATSCMEGCSVSVAWLVLTVWGAASVER